MILYIHGTTSWTYLKAGKSGTEVLAWIREHPNRTSSKLWKILQYAVSEPINPSWYSFENAT